ncbi:MAG TPA: hypothetical protein DIT04_06810 [Dysgonomonas sp.]|nr:hypothetical protein [Dysgonomonas sp.]
MKEFISHINYLIQKHDCVIIPDFGGFVISHEGASIMPNGSIMPPKVSVGFNPDLRSNDGLLAESYMTTYSISYDEASQKIEEAVKRLRIILGMKHPVQIGHLGKLSLDKNNRLTFLPNENLSIFHPDTFGLSKVDMKRLSDIEKDKEKVKRQSIVKKIFAGAGAAAAAIAIFFIASTPISVKEDTQKSGFMSDWTSTLPGTEKSIANVVASEQKTAASDVVEGVEIDDNAEEPQNSSLKLESDVKASSSDLFLTQDAVSQKSGGDYYIIIAGAGSQEEAKRLVNNFESEGITNLGVVASGKRVRIYAASFDSPQEADEYLVKFKKENPKFYDAWVYHHE